MGKAQRTKGAAGEREICDLIFQHLGIQVHRNLSQTRDGGADIKLNPYSIEVKRRAQSETSMNGWIRPATDVIRENAPLLFAVQIVKNGWPFYLLKNYSASFEKK